MSAKFQQGQKVILSDRRGELEATIERVGRKWAYITRYGREVAFDAVTGVERTQYGAADRIYTPQMWAEKHRRDDVLKKLAECGISWRSGGFERKYSTEVLERVVELLSADAGLGA